MWPPRVKGGCSTILLTDYLLSVEAVRMDGTVEGPIAFGGSLVADPSLCSIDVCMITSKIETSMSSPGSVSTSLSMSPRTPSHSGSNHLDERVDIVLRIDNQMIYHATSVVKIDLDESKKIFCDNKNKGIPSKPPSILILFDSCVFRIFAPSHSNENLEAHIKQVLRPSLAKLIGRTSQITDSLPMEEYVSQEAGPCDTSEQSDSTFKQSNALSGKFTLDSISIQMNQKAESIESSWKLLQQLEDMLHGPPPQFNFSATTIIGDLASSSANYLSTGLTTATNIAIAHEALDQESAIIQDTLNNITEAAFPPPRRTKSSPTKQSQDNTDDWEHNRSMMQELMEKYAEAVQRKHSLAVNLLARSQ